MAPRWRQLFDTWEKAVAPGLEDMTASTEFRQAMGSATRLNAAITRQFEEASRQWLHAMNLPTATDVRKLRRQIASLEDEVSALRRAVRTTPLPAEMAESNGAVPAKNNPKTTPKKKPKQRPRAAASAK